MEGGLPPRDSAAQDYWGYYNGSGGEYMTAGNTIVRQDMQTYSVNGYKNGGTNRNPDLYFLKIGTLNKITYLQGEAQSISIRCLPRSILKQKILHRQFQETFKEV